VLFYDVTLPSSPRLVRTFGIKGGLRAGTPGKVEPLKLFALRGAGTDSQGNVYVAMGMTMGEAIIRKFSPRGSLRWEVMCLAFVDCFDVLETAPGKFELYGTNEIIRFDPSKPPGQGWKLLAITRDHVRYPDDPRNRDPWGGAFIRVLHGKRVLFTTPQMGGGFRLFVFEKPPSQIARYAGEITLPNVEVWARNVDREGNIWLSDGKKIWRYRFTGFNAAGQPLYSLKNARPVGRSPAIYRSSPAEVHPRNRHAIYRWIHCRSNAALMGVDGGSAGTIRQLEPACQARMPISHRDAKRRRCPFPQRI
jgi:hypothetical protein